MLTFGYLINIKRLLPHFISEYFWICKTPCISCCLTKKIFFAFDYIAESLVLGYEKSSLYLLGRSWWYCFLSLKRSYEIRVLQPVRVFHCNHTMNWLGTMFCYWINLYNKWKLSVIVNNVNSNLKKSFQAMLPFTGLKSSFCPEMTFISKWSSFVANQAKIFNWSLECKAK